MAKQSLNRPKLSQAKLRPGSPEDEADLAEMMAEWGGAPMSEAARARCVWPEGKAGQLPKPDSMTARQWLICRRWRVTIEELVGDGRPLLDAIRQAMAGPTDAERWHQSQGAAGLEPPD